MKLLTHLVRQAIYKDTWAQIHLGLSSTASLTSLNTMYQDIFIRSIAPIFAGVKNASKLDIPAQSAILTKEVSNVTEKNYPVLDIPPNRSFRKEYEVLNKVVNRLTELVYPMLLALRESDYVQVGFPLTGYTEEVEGVMVDLSKKYSVLLHTFDDHSAVTLYRIEDVTLTETENVEIFKSRIKFEGDKMIYHRPRITIDI